MPSPFDFAKSINEKNYIFQENLDKKEYSSYLVNKIFSFHKDTLFLVNEINLYPNVDAQQHYDFLYHIVSNKKRYAKWVKPLKDDQALAISKAMNVRYERAVEMMKILDENSLNQLMETLSTGGKT